MLVCSLVSAVMIPLCRRWKVCIELALCGAGKLFLWLPLPKKPLMPNDVTWRLLLILGGAVGCLVRCIVVGWLASRM